MYALLTSIYLGPRTQKAAEAAADEVAPVFESLKGFRSATFFGDNTTGEFGVFTIWDSKEDAEAVSVVVVPVLRQALGDLLKSPLSLRAYEIYEPTA